MGMGFEIEQIDHVRINASYLKRVRRVRVIRTFRELSPVVIARRPGCWPKEHRPRAIAQCFPHLHSLRHVQIAQIPRRLAVDPILQTKRCQPEHARDRRCSQEIERLFTSRITAKPQRAGCIHMTTNHRPRLRGAGRIDVRQRESTWAVAELLLERFFKTAQPCRIHLCIITRLRTCRQNHIPQ